MSESAFIQGTRKQIRFASTRQQGLTIEDLWLCSLKSLDEIGQVILKALAPAGTSLLENPDPKVNSVNVDNQLRLEIIKTIIGVKQEENKANLLAAGNKRRKEMLQQILETKKIDQLGGKSIEELEKEIAALG